MRGKIVSSHSHALGACAPPSICVQLIEHGRIFSVSFCSEAVGGLFHPGGVRSVGGGPAAAALDFGLAEPHNP